MLLGFGHAFRALVVTATRGDAVPVLTPDAVLWTFVPAEGGVAGFTRFATFGSSGVVFAPAVRAVAGKLLAASFVASDPGDAAVSIFFTVDRARLLVSDRASFDFPVPRLATNSFPSTAPT